MSVYVLDREDRQSLEDIFKNVDKLQVVEETRKKLNEFSDKVCDELTRYLEDEYILRLDEIVLCKARKIVTALLKGEDLSAFALQTSSKYWGDGKEVSYDNDGVRAAIVERFFDKIQNAELVKLRDDNAQLKKDVEYFRKLREY